MLTKLLGDVVADDAEASGCGVVLDYATQGTLGVGGH